jgi:hypothetical protein
MREAQSFTYGVAIGVGLMFLLDPRQAGARRARIRDKSMRAIHEVEHATSIGARDLEHRAQGVVARMRGSGRHVADGHVIVERVRTTLGRHCSHPHAIQVLDKGGGCVELKGAILARDLEDVLHAVSRVPGVRAIDDDLVVHDVPGSIPGLQGGQPVHPRGRVFHASPALKLLGGFALAGVTLTSLFAGQALGVVAGGVGILALARSINDRSAPGLSRRRVRDELEVRERREDKGQEGRDEVAPSPM